MSFLTQFLDRTAKMATSRSKELRLTYEEANGLAIEIAKLMQTRLTEYEQMDGKVIISGGSLKPS